MPRYVIYTVTTGEISRSFDGPESAAMVQAGIGESLLESNGGETSGCIVSGAFVPYSAAQRLAKVAHPGPGWEWSNATMSWVDSRDLARKRAAKWESIKAAMARATADALGNTGNLFSDQELDLSPAMQLFIASSGGQVASRVMAAHAKGAGLRAQINSASAAQLDAITW